MYKTKICINFIWTYSCICYTCLWSAVSTMVNWMLWLVQCEFVSNQAMYSKAFSLMVDNSKFIIYLIRLVIVSLLQIKS